MAGLTGAGVGSKISRVDADVVKHRGLGGER
jgi:hypothetical protein